jgi:hypothetical protein
MAKKKRKKKPAEPLAVMTADTHLHPTTWTNRPTLVEDSFHAFTQIQEYAVEHDIHHMLIAGDVLDRRVNDAEVPYFLSHAMDYAQAHGLLTHYIQGQHDLQVGNKPWLSSVSAWPQHLHEYWASLGDFKVYGIDWTRPSDLPAAIEKIPEDTDILMMHQVCTEFMGAVRECELTIATLPHAKLLLLGDYHVHEQKRMSMTDGRRMQVLSPGSTCMQKIDEEPAKHFYVLYDNMTWSSQPIAGRRVLSARELVTHEAVDEFVEGVEDAIEEAAARAEADGLSGSLTKPILRVEYASSLEGAIRRIRRAVGNDAFLFEKRIVTPQDEGEEEGNVMPGVEARKVMEKAGLSGFLPRVLDRKHEKKLFTFCAELLDSPEPLAVIDGWRDKAGLAQEEEEDAVAE